MIANRLRCALLAAALLLGAPQTARADPAAPLPGETVLSFFVQLPDHGVALTTGGAVKMRRGPDGIAALAEPSLDNTLALICKLADGLDARHPRPRHNLSPPDRTLRSARHRHHRADHGNRKALVR